MIMILWRKEVLAIVDPHESQIHCFLGDFPRRAGTKKNPRHEGGHNEKVETFFPCLHTIV
jgi:hypothetical protein